MLSMDKSKYYLTKNAAWRKRYKEDREFAEEHKKKTREYKRERRKEDPKYVEHGRAYSRKYMQEKLKDPEKRKEHYARVAKRVDRVKNDPKFIEQGRKRSREWARKTYKSDPERKTKVQRRRVLYNYGLTEEQYKAMLKAQNYKCAICKEIEHVEEPYKRLHIDHCHDTGIIRGLLCGWCNTTYASKKFNIEHAKIAVEYLERTNP